MDIKYDLRGRASSRSAATPTFEKNKLKFINYENYYVMMSTSAGKCTINFHSVLKFLEIVSRRGPATRYDFINELCIASRNSAFQFLVPKCIKRVPKVQYIHRFGHILAPECIKKCPEVQYIKQSECSLGSKLSNPSSKTLS